MKITTFLTTICLILASCAPIHSVKGQTQATPIIEATSTSLPAKTATATEVTYTNGSRRFAGRGGDCNRSAPYRNSDQCAVGGNGNSNSYLCPSSAGSIARQNP